MGEGGEVLDGGGQNFCFFAASSFPSDADMVRFLEPNFPLIRSGGEGLPFLGPRNEKTFFLKKIFFCFWECVPLANFKPCQKLGGRLLLFVSIRRRRRAFICSVWRRAMMALALGASRVQPKAPFQFFAPEEEEDI